MDNKKPHNNTPEQDSQTPSSFDICKGIFLVLIIAFVAWLKYLFNKKVYKGELVKKYDVNPKTLAKWLKHLYFKDEAEFNNYTQKKKIAQTEFDKIVAFLGTPSDETPVLNKGQIIAHTEGSYEALRQTLLMFPKEIGISIKVYDTLDVFPPYLAQRLIHYNSQYFQAA